MNLGFEMSDIGLAMSTYTGTKLAQDTQGKLDGFEQNATQAIDALNQLLTQEMQDLITKGVDKIYESVGLTESNIAFAKNLLSTVSSGITKIGSIIKIIPTSITTIPSSKSTLSPLCASLKETAWSMYRDTLFQVQDAANALITQLGLPMELLAGLLFIAIEKIEAMVDELVYKYTGYHIIEIYNLCTRAILLINTLKTIKKAKAEGHEVKANVSVGINKDNINLSQSDLYNQVKAELFAYLKGIATPLYNAFMILQIKETAEQIKGMALQMCNISIKKLAADISSIEDVIGLLEEMIGTNPTYISLSDIANLGLNNVLAAANQIKTAVDNASNVSALTSKYDTGLIVGAAASLVDIKASASVQKAYTIEVGNNDSDGTTHFNMNIYKNPEKLIKGITKNLKKIKDDREQVIPNTEIARFMEELLQLWIDDKKQGDIIIYGKILTITRKYVFHITINANKEKGDEDSEKDDELKLENNSVLPVKQDLSEMLDTLANLISDLEDDTPEIIKDGNKDSKLIFDIIGILMKTLKPLIDILKKIAELIENYKINKAKVLAHSRGNLKISMEDIMNKLGLTKLLQDPVSEDGDNDGAEGKTENASTIDSISDENNEDDKTTNNAPNFYTVRTRRLYEYVMDMGHIPDEKNCVYISANDTNNMIEDCSSFINISPLNKDVLTTLYFDMEAVNEDKRIYINAIKGIRTERNGIKYKDGTTNGLDYVEVDPDGTVYISKNGRSTLTSELQRAIKRKYDPRI